MFITTAPASSATSTDHGAGSSRCPETLTATRPGRSPRQPVYAPDDERGHPGDLRHLRRQQVSSPGFAATDADDARGEDREEPAPAVPADPAHPRPHEGATLGFVGRRNPTKTGRAGTRLNYMRAGGHPILDDHLSPQKYCIANYDAEKVRSDSTAAATCFVQRPSTERTSDARDQRFHPGHGAFMTRNRSHMKRASEGVRLS